MLTGRTVPCRPPLQNRAGTRFPLAPTKENVFGKVLCSDGIGLAVRLHQTGGMGAPDPVRPTGLAQFPDAIGGARHISARPTLYFPRRAGEKNGGRLDIQMSDGRPILALASVSGSRLAVQYRLERVIPETIIMQRNAPPHPV